MAIVPLVSTQAEVEYPERDGEPMGETPVHRDNLSGVIDILRRHYTGDPMVYVSGNMFLYYEQGNPRKSVVPDVFIARVPAERYRRVYKTWEEEGRGPELVLELTSLSTRDEDLRRKFALYRDVLRVPEYFLYDPLGEYLDPPMLGFRLVGGEYVPIEAVDGRWPSEVLGLHFELGDEQLHLYDPTTRRTLLTSAEIVGLAEEARLTAELARRAESKARRSAEIALERAKNAQRREEASRIAAEAETERLRRELDELRRRLESENA